MNNLNYLEDNINFKFIAYIDLIETGKLIKGKEALEFNKNIPLKIMLIYIAL